MFRKHIITTLLFLLCALAGVQAQQLTVSSFKSLPTDLDARVNHRIVDHNNKVCALIKVENSNTGFVFDTGTLAVQDVKQKMGEIWVYVQPGVRKITIKHQSLGILRDYIFPEQIKEATVYAMKLESGSIPTYEKQVKNEAIAKIDKVKTRRFAVNGAVFFMVEVEGGTFTMGATDEQDCDAESDEKPAHTVTLNSYYIGQTEVTQELWQAVMGKNPSSFKGGNLPVEYVYLIDCREFIKKLNAFTGKKFRLPTEAEWEYAARGGKRSRGYKYSGSNNIDEVAWYRGNSDGESHPVACKKANELGIYDMSGNVEEWCSDRYGHYSSSPQTNPVGPSAGSLRVSRGGSWEDTSMCCRVSDRNNNSSVNRDDNLGLRLVLEP